ncbi:hypothetical protein K4A85_10620 [Bacillus pumilus]|nr:hypothetical protein K4A85_10620 [Bacillus pumilus]
MVKKEISELTEKRTFRRRAEILLIRKIQMTTKRIWEFVVQREEKRPRFLLEIFTVCTAVMLKCKAGKRK